MARHEYKDPDTQNRVPGLRGKLRGYEAFALYQTGTLCVVLTTLLVWPFLGRVLSQDQLGEVSLHLAIASIAAPALALGSHLYLANRFASLDPQASTVEARTAIIFTSALYMISALAICGSFLFPDSGVLLLVSLSSASAAYLVTAGVARGVDTPRRFATCALVVQVLGLLGLGIVVAATADLRNGVVVYVGMIGLPVALQFVLLRKRSSGAVKGSLMARTLRAASTLVPHLVLAVALLTAMRVLVALQLGNEAAANYTFASLIIGGSITIGASLDAHWSIRAQEASSSQTLDTRLLKNQKKTQVILLVTTVGIVTFLSVGLPLWLPDGYQSRGIILTVLCALPAASMQALADGRAAVLMWMGRPGLVSAATAAGTTVAIALAYLLLPKFGWPVIGTVLTAGMAVRAITTTLIVRAVCPESRVGSTNFLMLASQVVSAGALVAFM